MPEQAVLEYIAPQISYLPQVTPEPVASLASLRPAPHRDAGLVALRAEALGLVPYCGPAKPYPLWPLLIIAGVAVAYLYAGLVLL